MISVIAEKIRSEIPPADISEVMERVDELLDKSVSTEGYVIRSSATAQNYIDLSKIDFEALKEKFEKGRKPIEAQKLRVQVAQKLVQMVRLNRTRMNFLEEFQKMIDEYNAGASNLETLFDRLMSFTKRLSEEEKRGISEQLTEEELAIFDLLTKPEMKLTKAEEREVKKVAKELLESLKREKLVLDWKKRQTTRAAVRYTVETMLDHLQELSRHSCTRRNANWSTNMCLSPMRGGVKEHIALTELSKIESPRHKESVSVNVTVSLDDFTCGGSLLMGSEFKCHRM